MREKIKKLVASIKAFDTIEQKHITDVIAWIDSNVEIFRIKKPDVPPKHLVSYFALIDNEKRKLLLVNHIKAGKLLLPGGHVEKNEDPKNTVKREIKEELGINADFLIDKPVFITVTQTVNIDAGHTDVSLWYLLKGDQTQNINYDPQEVTGYQWFSYDEVLAIDINKLDQHMHRFIDKLYLL